MVYGISTGDSTGNLPPLPLLPQHLADLRKSGLTDDTIRAAGLYSEGDAAKVAGHLRFRQWFTARLGPCLAFPFAGQDGKPTGYTRVKPDTPQPLKPGGKPAKYLSPRGTPNRVYYPPKVLSVLTDAGCPLIVTEGEKKSLRADQDGFACLGLTGVWNWIKPRRTGEDGQKIGEKVLMAELARVAWAGRVVFITFDSDAATNESVRSAEWHLARVLADLGADVRVVRLPSGPGGSKMGLDDFLEAHGSDALRRLMETAGPATKPGAKLIRKDEAMARDMADYVRGLLTPTCPCEKPRTLGGKRKTTGQRMFVRRGCHRGDCPTCGMKRMGWLFDETAPFLMRMTDTDPAENPNGPMRVYAAVLPTDRDAAVKRAVQRRGGKYLAIPTTDPHGCRESITGESVLSQLRQGGCTDSCRKCDTPTADAGTDLWVVILPGHELPPDGFTETHITRAFHAIGNAMLTRPAREDGVKRHRAVRKSQGWGDRIERPVGDFTPDGIGVLSFADTKAVLETLGVGFRARFAGEPGDSAVGIRTTPSRALALHLLLCGADAPTDIRVEKERVIDLGRQWLAHIPGGIGDGPAVERVLRRHLWTGPGWMGRDELADAQAEDGRHAAVMAEGAAIYRSVAEQYRHDPGSFPPWLVEFLGLAA